MLKHYAAVKSYYKLAKTVEGRPRVRRLEGRKKLRRYVEGAQARDPAQGEIMVHD